MAGIAMYSLYSKSGFRGRSVLLGVSSRLNSSSRENILDCLGMPRDHSEQDASREFRFAAALFPIPQRRKREPKSLRKSRLAELHFFSELRYVYSWNTKGMNPNAWILALHVFDRFV